MAKIKGITKLNKSLTKLFRKEFGISEVKISNEYEYNFVLDRIKFKITHTIEDTIFNAFIAQHYGMRFSIDAGFLFSLLHEVGHAKTGDDINDEEYQYAQKQKELINERMAFAGDDIEEITKIELDYFLLPDEILATDWAINYLKENPKKSKKIYKKIQKMLRKFYKKNKIGADTP